MKEMSKVELKEYVDKIKLKTETSDFVLISIGDNVVLQGFA